MPDKPISSAQRLAARQYGVDLPTPDPDPFTTAENVLEEAAAKDPGGWSTGGAEAVVEASRAAVQARRSRHTA
jgi:hypothetical protein